MFSLSQRKQLLILALILSWRDGLPCSATNQGASHASVPPPSLAALGREFSGDTGCRVGDFPFVSGTPAGDYR
jgi:hypothetical protein